MTDDRPEWFAAVPRGPGPLPLSRNERVVLAVEAGGTERDALRFEVGYGPVMIGRTTKRRRPDLWERVKAGELTSTMAATIRTLEEMRGEGDGLSAAGSAPVAVRASSTAPTATGAMAMPTVSQTAMLAAEMTLALAGPCRERQARVSGRDAARHFGVGRSTADFALAVLRSGDEGLIRRVKSGEVSVSAAAKGLGKAGVGQAAPAVEAAAAGKAEPPTAAPAPADAPSRMRGGRLAARPSVKARGKRPKLTPMRTAARKAGRDGPGTGAVVAPPLPLPPPAPRLDEAWEAASPLERERLLARVTVDRIEKLDSAEWRWPYLASRPGDERDAEAFARRTPPGARVWVRYLADLWAEWLDSVVVHLDEIGKD